jgi:hypothetical protein
LTGLAAQSPAIALHVAHYNFVQVHGTLKVTPAMEAGIVSELWTSEHLYDAVMA